MFEQVVQEEREKDNDLLIAFYQTVQEKNEEKKGRGGTVSICTRSTLALSHVLHSNN